MRSTKECVSRLYISVSSMVDMIDDYNEDGDVTRFVNRAGVWHRLSKQIKEEYDIARREGGLKI